MTRKEWALQLREQGLTYREVAEMLGVSWQRAAQLCGKQNIAYFRHIDESCIYHNLRAWMNEHKVSRAELLRRMGLTTNPENSTKLSKIMCGEWQPRKPYIDKMLQVTGLSYEKLFEVSDSGN